MGKGNLVTQVVKAIGGRPIAAALVKPPASPNTVANAEGEGRVRLSGLCLEMARAWAGKTGAKPADELAMARRLAGLPE